MKCAVPRASMALFKRIVAVWLLLAVGLVTDVQAFVLGDIHVNSLLGQPLQARIALDNPENFDLRKLGVGLAGHGDYEKLGLQYPLGIKFEFQVVNGQTSPAIYIDIATFRPVNDPFINLLVEVTLPSGKLFKSYTFLLDPPPEFFNLPGGSFAESEAEATGLQQAGVQASNNLVDSQGVAVGKPLVHDVSDAVPKRKVRTVSKPVKKSSVKRPRKVKSDALEKTIAPAKSALKISKFDPSMPMDTQENMAALREELIAKEKILEELNAQIIEMQTMIKALRSGVQAQSAVAASGVLVASAVGEAGVVGEASAGGEANRVDDKPPVLQLDMSPIADADKSVEEPFEESWQFMLLLLLGLLFALGGGGYYWYRKNKQSHGEFHGSHELYPEFYEPTESTPPPVKADDTLMMSTMVEKAELSFIQPAKEDLEFPSLMQFQSREPEGKLTDAGESSIESGTIASTSLSATTMPHDDKVDVPVETSKPEAKQTSLEEGELLDMTATHVVAAQSVAEPAQSVEFELPFMVPLFTDEAVSSDNAQPEAERVEPQVQVSSMDVLDFDISEADPNAPAEYDLVFDEDSFLRPEDVESVSPHESTLSPELSIVESDAGKSDKVDEDYLHEYLALLAIYQERGDVAGFEALARQLKDIGNDASFEEAAEMGRRLDPENALYR